MTCCCHQQWYHQMGCPTLVSFHPDHLALVAGTAAEDEAHAQSAAAVQSTVDSGVGGIFFGDGEE